MARASRVAAVLFLAAVPSAAQGPDAPWRTLETPHFRVYYTAPAEAWSRRAAADLEAARERLIHEVGYTPPERVDVVVADPLAQANGMALPVLRHPRIVLWTTPPGAASVLGGYRDWTEELTVHEEAHLVHLLRPSRDPALELLAEIFPVGPLALKAPRWVIEGYATHLEGSLTGGGRPNSDLRAAILRTLARAGRLPSYAGLSAESRRWLGGSMAYLAGSAYLEWLVARAGPDSLRHLWARMSARTNRSFDDAFAGVFGDTPEQLYARFCAELTHSAIDVERAVAAAGREGEPWQELSGRTGAPALSPDGTRLAAVVRPRERASRIVVWSTAADVEAEKRWRDRIGALHKRDPQDVAPVRSKPLARTPVAERVTTDGAEPSGLRFMPDGQSLLYVRFEPDRDGFLHPDLFTWKPATGEVRRLTWRADVRDPDPAPDGRWAVAVRERHGLSQLVRVELGDGSVEALTPPSLDDVFDAPRVDRDGRHVLFLVHRDGGWRLVVRALASGDEREVALPPGAAILTAAWAPDGGHVLASLGHDGLIDLAELGIDGGAPRWLTRSAGAALAPASAGGGDAAYFLSLSPDGLDVRTISLAERALTAPPPALAADLVPAVRPPAAPAPPLPTAAAGPAGRLYGLGRQEIAVLVGGALAPSSHGVEAGLRLGDVIGRLDLLAVGARAEGGPSGGALAAAWRGWPVELEARVFSVAERPSDRPAPGSHGTDLDVDRDGIAIAAGRAWRWRTAGARLGLDVDLGTVRPAGGRTLARRTAALGIGVSHGNSRGSLRAWQELAGTLTTGRTADDDWQVAAGRLECGVAHGALELRAAWGMTSSHSVAHGFDRVALGGIESTVLPAGAVPGRVEAPALELGTVVADEIESQRVSFGTAPVALFVERYGYREPAGAPWRWMSLAGIEVAVSEPPLPLLRLPGVSLRAGAARVLDQPLEGATRWWLALAYRP